MSDIDRDEVRRRLDAVVAAMKSSDVWDTARPRDDAFVDMGAFGTRTMAFEQWLRWVLVPNVEALIASEGPWPPASGVAAQAARESGHGNDRVGELVGPLAAFDALFSPPDPARSAADAYARSRAAFAAGHHAPALAAIREALAADERYPNAHNYAGWILSRKPDRTPAELDEAIAQFRAAHALAPDDDAPMANLCDALVAAGRDGEAVAVAERAGTPAAHNWLGWHLLSSRLPQAIERFQAAVAARPWWGLARVNLGRALENAGRDDEWFAQFTAALECTDDFDRAYCHERIAAYQARHGWLRNALVSLRAALREDDRSGGGERRALHVEGLAWVEAQLRAAGVEPPHRDDDAWRRARELELPPGFGARNEAGELLADDVIEVERLIRAERWNDAVAQLRMFGRTDPNKLFDAVRFAEPGAELAWHAGRHDEAVALQELVIDAYVAYASSGGERLTGRAALDDVLARRQLVDDARARLAAWRKP